MRSITRSMLLLTTVTAGMLTGCGSVWPVDPSEGDSFLAIDATSFGGPEALPALGNTTTAATNTVAIPDDLVLDGSEQITMSLNVPQIDVGGADTGRVNPRSADGTFHATITFHLAPRGEDACTSTITSGPYELTQSKGKITIAKSSLPLSDDAATLVRQGQFEICAETSADFDGVLSVNQLIIEFGRLHPDDTRVEICHISPGNPDARHTITIASSALQAHLNKGDTVGACPETVQPLQLAAAVCSEHPDLQRRWQIINPNSDAIQVTWEVYGTGHTGTSTATVGESYFLADAVDGSNTTIIRWLDGNNVIHSAVGTSDGTPCDPDTDADGVLDSADACPNTLGGEAVDTAGCGCSQLDPDGDGVNSCSDTCPDTPAGETIDTTGCSCSQSDLDGDGVNSCLDTCPGTPAGETVDTAGCGCSQLDDDGDGVNSCNDICLDTPAGEAVDTTGCSCSQSDLDGDGVSSCSDTCPNTPAGEAADTAGCSCSQHDEDSDGINDCEDLCPGTQAGSPVDAVGCEIIVADAGADTSLTEAGPATLHGLATGGTPPYRYTWSAPGWAGSNSQNPSVMVASTTTFTLVVTDWSFPPQTAMDTITITIVRRQGLQYTITDLGSLASRNSYATGLNDVGQVVGRYVTDTWDTKPFLYSNGVMTDLGTLGGRSAEAVDINNAGQVVGTSDTASAQRHAFIWDADNNMRDLGTLGGSTSEAYAINESGQVAGYAENGSGYQAFVHSGGVMAAMDMTGYSESAAFDVNNHGHLVGVLLPSVGNSVAFMRDGTLHDLGSPLLSASQAWQINDNGVIIGHSWASGQYRSFLYAEGVSVDLGGLTGFAKTYAWGLSSAGQVVGNVSNTSGAPLSHAFVYTGGTMYDLNTLLIPGHGWEYLISANAVNSHGQIVGYGKINGQYRAFLLTPVP